MVDFADDPGGELRRKVKTLRVAAVVETVSYLVLLAFWVTGNRVGVRIFGSVHGMVFLVFAAMVVGLRRDLGWTWGFVAAALLTGPIGAVIVYERIRRDQVLVRP